MGITNNIKAKAVVKKTKTKKHNRRNRHLQEQTTKTVNVSTRSGAMLLRSGLRKKNDAPIHIKKEKEDVKSISDMLFECANDTANEGEDEKLLQEEAKPWDCPKCKKTLLGDDPSCNAILIDGTICGGRRRAGEIIGWGNTLLFNTKPDDGTWRCDECRVSNQPNDTICVSCQTPKPGSADTVAVATSNTGGGGGSTSAAFGGGVVQQQPPVGVTFGVSAPQATSETTAIGGLTFGAAPQQGQQQQTPAKTSGFTFGFTSATTSAVSSLLTSPLAMFK